MNTDLLQRQPHAVLDLPSRRHKGLKIERLLELHNRTQPIRILEIGTGSGGIAHYFGTHPNLRCDVTAVDVVDQRQVTDGYHFEQVLDVPSISQTACSFSKRIIWERFDECVVLALSARGLSNP